MHPTSDDGNASLASQPGPTGAHDQSVADTSQTSCSDSHHLRPWWFEAAGLLLSIAAFVSLMVLLRFIDNTPLSQWHSFSVNTVVSTLAIVMRAPVAFVVPLGGYRSLPFLWHGGHHLRAKEL
ncbi:hypothetical protein QBC38DRAFT_462085 [Podospora fimiseda]|uniref:Uncharacterized protein n=1 Tax=Podospora fimiseda TaxID=252190 RepID=A0AAN6YR60_9PEZI|nr:hypothetical protein QBC38DRAFT_462085 [Podospora fimiseda]